MFNLNHNHVSISYNKSDKNKYNIEIELHELKKLVQWKQVNCIWHVKKVYIVEK